MLLASRMLFLEGEATLSCLPVRVGAGSASPESMTRQEPGEAHRDGAGGAPPHRALVQPVQPQTRLCSRVCSRTERGASLVGAGYLSGPQLFLWSGRVGGAAAGSVMARCVCARVGGGVVYACVSVGVVQCAHMCAGVPFPSDSNPLQRRRPAPSLGHVGVNFSMSIKEHPPLGGKCM